MFLQDPDSPSITWAGGRLSRTNRTTQTHRGAAERAEGTSKSLGRPALDHESGITRKRILDPRTRKATASFWLGAVISTHLEKHGGPPQITPRAGSGVAFSPPLMCYSKGQEACCVGRGTFSALAFSPSRPLLQTYDTACPANVLDSQSAGSPRLRAFPTQACHLCKQAAPTLSSPAGLLATGIPLLPSACGSLDPRSSTGDRRLPVSLPPPIV